MDNLNEYNNRLKDLEGLLETSVEDSILLDTTSMSMNDVSIGVTSQILPVIRKRYIKAFQQKYNLQ